MLSHLEKVARIQNELEIFYKNNQKVKINHGSTNSTRKNTNDVLELYTGDLNHILEINIEQNYITVEPNVPMDELVEYTLQYNLLPAVVPEFPGITVGGAVQGGAGESSSFKYGGFHQCCISYEIVTADSQVLNISKDDDEYIFNNISCTNGSVCVMTAIKVKLIKAKPFVKLTYIKTQSYLETVELIQTKRKENIDFVDAILFSKNIGTVITGEFSAKIDLPVVQFSKPSDQWFFIHANNVAKRYKEYSELVPIRDYLFRYDRGAFWTGKYVFEIIKIPFVKPLRTLLDRQFRTRKMYKLLHATGLGQRYIIQDICLPSEQVHMFLEAIEKTFNIYPLWLCPLTNDDMTLMSPTNLRAEDVINIGIWGSVPKNVGVIEANRLLEDIVIKHNGRKVLYSQTYYTPQQFWEIYEKNIYDEVRNKLNAENVFVNIYDKVYVKKLYNTTIIKGLWNINRNIFKD
jgi:Delta24-sterol reductase